MRSLYSSFHNGMGLIYTKIDDLNHMGVLGGDLLSRIFFVAKNIEFEKVFFKERKQKKVF